MKPARIHHRGPIDMKGQQIGRLTIGGYIGRGWWSAIRGISAFVRVRGAKPNHN